MPKQKARRKGEKEISKQRQKARRKEPKKRKGKEMSVKKVAWAEEDESYRQALIDNAKAYAKAEHDVISLDGSVLEDIQHAMALLMEQDREKEFGIQHKYDLSLAESPLKEALVAARILRERNDMIAVLFRELNYDDSWALLESCNILDKVADEYNDMVNLGKESLSEENERLKNQLETLVKENEKILISDIEELKEMLDDFIMVQGSDCKLNEHNAANILETYKCQTKYPSIKANFVLETVLQHYAITTILEDAPRIINPTLESDRGEDDITPTKARRQNTFGKHLLIKETANKLLNAINKYREVVDEETRNELRDQSIQITYKIIDIFCIRLKAQAFEPTYQFFQAGHDVDARLMQGTFSEQEVKNLEVEACGFPCIALFGGDDSNPRVFTKAKIIARPKKE